MQTSKMLLALIVCTAAILGGNSPSVAGQDANDPAVLGDGYEVAYVYLVEDESGQYYAIGEVRQIDPATAPGTIYGFNLRFLDTEDDVIFGDYAFLWRVSADENGLIPFIMDVELPDSVRVDDVMSAEAQSCGTQFAGSFDVYSDSVTFDVSDLKLSKHDGYYSYNLSGKVTNTGTQTNPYDFAVTDFHRIDGLLLGMAQVEVGPGLESDQSGYVDSDFDFYGRRGENYITKTPADQMTIHMTGSDGITAGCGEGGKWDQLPIIDPDKPFDITGSDD